MTRIVCLSDTHGQHYNISSVPAGDILIHAGDFTYFGKRLGQFQRTGFVEWLASQPHPYKVVVAGNHEEFLEGEEALSARAYLASQGWNVMVGDPAARTPAATPDEAGLGDGKDAPPGIYYLQNATVRLCGLKLHGAPQQPTYMNLAFNVDGESARKAIWDRIPADVDVLVTHSPPAGILDTIGDGVGGQKSAGCGALTARLAKLKNLSLHVFGHVHRGYGFEEVPELSTAFFVNAAMCAQRHALANSPLVVDWDEAQGSWVLVDGFRTP